MLEVDKVRCSQPTSQLADNIEAMALELVRTQHILSTATSQMAASVAAADHDIIANATSWSQSIELRMHIGFEHLQAYLVHSEHWLLGRGRILIRYRPRSQLGLRLNINMIPISGTGCCLI